MGGPPNSEVDFAARLGAAGRVFLKQQPSGEVKMVGGGWYRDSATGRFVPNPVSRIDTRNLTTLKTFEFPFGPKEITYEGTSLDFQEIQRPGLKPILKSIAPKLKRIALSAVLADRPSFGVDSIEGQISILEEMAQDDLDLSFVHGGVHLGYLIRMTSMTVTSLERTLNGEITRAMVDLNFQESNSLNVSVVSLEAITAEPTTPDAVPGSDPPEQAPEMGHTGAETEGGASFEPVVVTPTGTGPGLEQLLIGSG